MAGAEPKNLFKNLVPISKAPEIILVAEKTLRNWRSQGRYQQIFIKLGGKVFVDLQEVMQIIEDQKEKNINNLKFTNKQEVQHVQ